jgi:hypothetical protein
MIVDDEFGRTKEVVVTYFKIAWNVHGGTGENHKNTQSG